MYPVHSLSIQVFIYLGFSMTQGGYNGRFHQTPHLERFLDEQAASCIRTFLHHRCPVQPLLRDREPFSHDRGRFRSDGHQLAPKRPHNGLQFPHARLHIRLSNQIGETYLSIIVTCTRAPYPGLVNVNHLTQTLSPCAQSSTLESKALFLSFRCVFYQWHRTQKLRRTTIYIYIFSA